MWHSLDDAAEVVAVLDLDIGERVLRDTRHVAGAFVKTAELATVADRAAHLVGKFRHDLIVHFAHIGDPGLHKGNAVVQRARRPIGLRRLGAGDGGVSRVSSEGRTLSVD